MQAGARLQEHLPLCEEGTFSDVQRTKRSSGRRSSIGISRADGVSGEVLENIVLVFPKTFFKNTMKDRFFYYSSMYNA